jgi:hypothetical protein
MRVDVNESWACHKPWAIYHMGCIPGDVTYSDYPASFDSYTACESRHAGAVNDGRRLYQNVIDLGHEAVLPVDLATLMLPAGHRPIGIKLTPIVERCPEPVEG